MTRERDSLRCSGQAVKPGTEEEETSVPVIITDQFQFQTSGHGFTDQNTNIS